MHKSKKWKDKLCRCIKTVRAKLPKKYGRTGKQRESAAIGICVKSVLQTKGRTLKKFRCTTGRKLITQKPIKKLDSKRQ